MCVCVCACSHDESVFSINIRKATMGMSINRRLNDIYCSKWMLKRHHLFAKPIYWNRFNDLLNAIGGCSPMIYWPQASWLEHFECAAIVRWQKLAQFFYAPKHTHIRLSDGTHQHYSLCSNNNCFIVIVNFRFERLGSRGGRFGSFWLVQAADGKLSSVTGDGVFFTIRFVAWPTGWQFDQQTMAIRLPILQRQTSVEFIFISIHCASQQIMRTFLLRWAKRF